MKKNFSYIQDLVEFEGMTEAEAFATIDNKEEKLEALSGFLQCIIDLADDYEYTRKDLLQVQKIIKTI